MEKRLKTINIILTIGISGIFIVLAATAFSDSYRRCYEAVIALLESVRYYFCVLFRGKASHVSVTEYSEIFSWEGYLPSSFQEFKVRAAEYIILLFSKENVAAFLYAIAKIAGIFARVLAILFPCFVIAVVIVRRIYRQSNTKHNQNTLPLKVYLAISDKVFQPGKRLFRQYVVFLKARRQVWVFWLTVWVFSFNLASIAVSFFAYYFYFAVSFDVGNLYVQVCKLIIDLQVVFRTVPLWAMMIVAWCVFDRWRKKYAASKLRHFEARNCGFINELPIVSMSCGSMGRKKTTLITDMALSQEVMFRQKAFAILQKTDLKFPFFPWICLERELKQCMKHHTVYNLATVKQWIELKEKRFSNHGDIHRQLYGYDYEKYGAEFDDALKVSTLFEALKTYAQAYFIYVVESSLIVSNYSVRTDTELVDEGNFPLWYTNFFPNGITQGRFSKILDFDTLRLGRKVMENNPNIGSFEFGVVLISEVGKERCNNLELKEVKKGAEETNQKNDLFNSWLKMCRHSATVENFPFIKVFTDEQRPESWGADARELCDILHIVKAGEEVLALPFYTIEDMISEWIFNRFIAMYYDFRFRRGDNTLLVHVLKNIVSWVWKRNLRIYNRYGYCTLKIEKERGTMDGKTERKKYFLMNQKIYSRRFSTDCFSDYFNELAQTAKVGLADYRAYLSEKASVEELKTQNSYFINSLYK